MKFAIIICNRDTHAHHASLTPSPKNSVSPVYITMYTIYLPEKVKITNWRKPFTNKKILAKENEEMSKSSNINGNTALARGCSHCSAGNGYG